MKKPTNPLPSDIRYGGFLVLPILAAFQGQSNVVTPSSLAFRVGLAEPLASWAIYALHAMGVLKPVGCGCEVRHHVKIYNLPNKRHFIQRLSRSRAKGLVEHVLSNAQAANANPSSEFSFDMIGVFGSVLHGSSAPGDVDIVYVARFKETGAIIPESNYYPFSRDLPTDRAERVLRRGARQADVNCHDLREVQSVGAGYQVIWAREEGRVTRTIAATKNAPDPEAAGEDGILQTDAKCETFRRACSDSSPLPSSHRTATARGCAGDDVSDLGKDVARRETGDSLGPLSLFPSGSHQDFSGELDRQMACDRTGRGGIRRGTTLPLSRRLRTVRDLEVESDERSCEG